MLIYVKKKNVFYEKIEDLSGLSTNHPILSISLLNCFIFTCGNSTISRFFCKILYFYGCYRTINVFFSNSRILSTVVAAFYYLRLIKIIYFDKPKEKFETDHNIGLKVTLAISTGILILYFIYPGLLMRLVSRITLI